MTKRDLRWLGSIGVLFAALAFAMPASAQERYAGKLFYRLVPEQRTLTWDNSRMELKESS